MVFNFVFYCYLLFQNITLFRNLCHVFQIIFYLQVGDVVQSALDWNFRVLDMLKTGFFDKKFHLSRPLCLHY